ncbi:MAG TPA: CAP domain-containing protein [Nannocystaceae bacterium]|nr:CAP domain-containing protein [Nannocystaceae bacterium]
MDAELRHAALTVALLFACDADDPLHEREGGLPDVEFCADVIDWRAGSIALEHELFDAIAAARAESHDCGGLGRAAPSAPLVHDGALRCAARAHALDMQTREYFGHDDPDGRLPWHRIADAGYSSVLATEVIAQGDVDPRALVDELWLRSDAHCGALLASEWIDVGIGHHTLAEPPPDSGSSAPTWWVVVLAVPDAT